MENTIKITRDKAREILWTDSRINSGKIFSCEFVKRTNGKIRTMNSCRRHVKKGLVGGSLKYDAKAYDLVPVYIMASDENFEPEAKNRRMIPIDTLRWLKLAGIKMIVED
jgi:hypothetical protein